MKQRQDQQYTPSAPNAGTSQTRSDSLPMLFERVDRLLPWTKQPEIVYECRNCGTSVSEDTEACPTCGADAIAMYRIS